MARDKGRGKGESLDSPRRVRGVEREGQAVALRIAGRTLQEIAEALGYATRQGASLAISRALKRIGSPEVAEYRELITARLEKVVATWYPVMITQVTRVDGVEMVNDVDDRMKATHLILKALTDLRALHGTDLERVPGSSEEEPLYIAPVRDVELTWEQVEALIALDPGLKSRVIDQEGNDVSRNGHGGEDDD